jgi:hypothetical protein
MGIGKLDLEPAIVISDIEKQLIATDLDFLAGKQRLLVAATAAVFTLLSC